MYQTGAGAGSKLLGPDQGTELSDLFRIFFSGGKGRQTAFVALLVLMALSQSIGLATLLPILSLVDDSVGLPKSGIKAVLTNALASFGLVPSLGVLLSILIAATAFRVLFVWVSTHFIMLEVARIARDLRMLLIEALMRARWSYFTSQPVGRFSNSISEEATEASECYMNAGTAISQMARLAIYLGFTALVQWQVAVAVIVVVPTIWFLMRRLRLQARRAGRRRNRRTRELSVRIADSLTNMKPLKASGRDRHFLKLIRRDARKVNRSLRRETFTEELLKNVQEPVVAALLCIGLYFLVAVWKAPLSTTLALALLVVGSLDSMQLMQAALQRVLLQRASFWAIHELVRDVDETKEIVPEGAPPTFVNRITLQKVNLSLNGRHILRDVDLAVPSGQLTVLIGPSGAGKTTIADLIAGLHRPDEGSLLIDGVDIGQTDLKAWRSKIGYVPQENLLFNDTIRNNVTLGDPSIPDEDVETALTLAGLGEFLGSLSDGLDHTVGERGTMLSGGQRQRISIARALVCKPWLLVLDEATSALDHNTAIAIRDQVRLLAGGVTVLVITHQQIWIEVADCIYRIGDGGRAEPVETGAAAQPA